MSRRQSARRFIPVQFRLFCSRRRAEIARLLLEKGAYPNPPVESSADALSIAIRNSDPKMVELLCSYGAARSVEDEVVDRGGGA